MNNLYLFSEVLTLYRHLQFCCNMINFHISLYPNLGEQGIDRNTFFYHGSFVKCLTNAIFLHRLHKLSIIVSIFF